MTLVRLAGFLALLMSSTTSATTTGGSIRQLRNLQQGASNSDSNSTSTSEEDMSDVESFFCMCDCNGEQTAAIWISINNKDYNATAEQGEDEEGTKYSWACESDAKVFDYLYDTNDVFCDNKCEEEEDEDLDLDEEGRGSSSSSDSLEEVDTDGEFYKEREKDQEGDE